MDPQHNLFHKYDQPNFNGFKMTTHKQFKERKFIWGSIPGESLRSWWKPKRKDLNYFRLNHHADFDSDHEDNQFLTNPQNIQNANERRNKLKRVRTKLQKVIKDKEAEYGIKKPVFVDEKFKPNLKQKAVLLDLDKEDEMQDVYNIDEMIPLFYDEGFLTFLQEHNVFTKKMYDEFQDIFQNKKLKKYGLRNVYKYLKRGVQKIGKKYKQNELLDEFDGELTKDEKESDIQNTNIELESHPYLKHYETNENLRDERFQTFERRLGEDEGKYPQFDQPLNVTQTIQNVEALLKKIVEINPKAMFKFSYLIKSILYRLQVEFQEVEVAEGFEEHLEQNPSAITDMKKKEEKQLREQYLKNYDPKTALTKAEKQYKKLVKKIKSKVEKKYNKEDEYDEEKINEKIKKLQWINDNPGAKHISQALQNKQSYLHQDNIYDNQNDDDFESMDEIPLKGQKRQTAKYDYKKKQQSKQKQQKKQQPMQKQKQQKSQKQGVKGLIHDKDNYLGCLRKLKSIRNSRKLYHKTIKEYHNLRTYQDLLNKKEIGLPPRYLRTSRLDEQSKKDKKLSQRSKSAPIKYSQKLSQKRRQRSSYSEDRTDDLIQKFKKIKAKESQRDLFRIVSILLHQKQRYYKSRFNERRRQQYYRKLSREELIHHEQMYYLKELNKKDSIYNKQDILQALQLSIIKFQSKFIPKRTDRITKKQNLYRKKKFELLKSENDYQHTLFFRQFVRKYKSFFPKLFGIDVAGNYLYYYKLHAKQMFDNYQVIFQEGPEEKKELNEFAEQSEQDEQVEKVEQVEQVEQVEENLEKENPEEIEHIMPQYLKYAEEYTQQLQQNENDQEYESDPHEFDFENEIFAENHGMDVEYQFDPIVNDFGIQDDYEVDERFQIIKDSQKHQSELEEEIQFPFIQDMYDNQTYNNCFTKEFIYFDETQRAQYDAYKRLIMFRSRPQLPKELQQRMNNNQSLNHQQIPNGSLEFPRFLPVDFNSVLKTFPPPLKQIYQNKRTLVKVPVTVRNFNIRTHNLPIKMFYESENQYQAQTNFYRKFAQYSKLRKMPRLPPAPYQAFKRKHFNGKQSVEQSVEAIKAWMNLDQEEKDVYLKEYAEGVIQTYRKLQEWRRQSNISKETLDLMGVMKRSDFTYFLNQIEFCRTQNQALQLMKEDYFDEVIINFARHHLNRRHPDKINRNKKKQKRDLRARAKGEQLLQKRRQERRQFNIDRFQARRNEDHASQYAQYFGQGPLLQFFENVYVKSIRTDVGGIMRKAIHKFKFQEKVIYVDGKGVQDFFVPLDEQGQRRVRVPRIFDKVGYGELQQTLMDQDVAEQRKNDNWIDEDYKKYPQPRLTVADNCISTGINEDYSNQVRVCSNVYFDNINQRAQEVAKIQNIQSNHHLIQKQEEERGFTTVLFDDNEWLVSNHDIKPFIPLLEVTRDLEIKEEESALEKKLKESNMIRRQVVHKQEIEDRKKKNLYTLRDLPKEQQPADTKAFVNNIDEEGIMEDLKQQQDYIQWLQKVKQYEKKGYDVSEIVYPSQQDKKEELAIPPSDEERKLFRQKLEGEFKIKETKAKLNNNEFIKEKKKNEYLASLLQIDENYKKEQQESSPQKKVLNLKSSDKRKIDKLLKRLKINQNNLAKSKGMEKLVELVPENVHNTSSKYENVLLVEQLEKEIKSQLKTTDTTEIRHKPWYFKQNINKDGQQQDEDDEGEGDNIMEDREEQNIEDQRQTQSQGMKIEQTQDSIKQSQKQKQVKKVQFQDNVSKNKAGQKKNQKQQESDEYEQSSSESEQVQNKNIKAQQGKQQQVQQQKGKQQRNIQGSQQEKGQNIKKSKNKLRRNDMDEEQVEIEQESQIVESNKRRQRNVQKSRVKIDTDDEISASSPDDFVQSDSDSDDYNKKNKKKGGHKQKGRNNRR